jgi:hypothetical protein
MGIRSRLKGAIKRAVIGDGGAGGSSVRPAAAPSPAASAVSVESGGGNLSGGEDVPWYLQDGDPDGWDSTNATGDLDED